VVRELLDDQPIFIGFKMDGALSRQLRSLAGPERRYVSTDSSDFLRICRLGEQRYVGKLIHERLTIERVDDVRRNIHSILNRLCPDTRLPRDLAIIACGLEERPDETLDEGEAVELDRPADPPRGW
jgi:hypothetical protein